MTRVRKEGYTNPSPSPFSTPTLLEPKAYFFNGFIISCDHTRKGYASTGMRDEVPDDDHGCSRFAVFTAFVDPTCSGQGPSEYKPPYGDKRDWSNTYESFNGGGYDDGTKDLDCHYPSRSGTWIMMGAYIVEAYQFLEQMTKVRAVISEARKFHESEKATILMFLWTGLKLL